MKKFMKKLIILVSFIFMSSTLFAQTLNVKGLVTDAVTGETLLGVNVIVKNSSKGDVTDFDGNYKISGVPKGSILVFSYLGYQTKEITADQEVINAALEESSETLDEIVVVGYGSQRKELVSGAFSSLNADKIAEKNPARIEEVVKKTENEIDDEIIQIGKKTTIDLGIHGLHPELIKMVGRMRYRSSYGQNLLQHSRETANMCATMAAELGLNTKYAKRAGLLHDIGKVSADDAETPHAIIGMKLAEKFGEKPEVCNAIGAHHDEVEMTNLISPLVQVCDGVSGARPGARRAMADQYIKRIKELEETAITYPGVLKSYAIQAGRELRVVVESEKVTDDEASKLAFNISDKIQNEMTYPGQVKVTVIRETRAISYAK